MIEHTSWARSGLVLLAALATMAPTSCLSKRKAGSTDLPTPGTPGTPGSSDVTFDERAARVMPHWQKVMWERLQSADDSDEAWGVFSQAGYADEGQRLIFRKADKPELQLDLVMPGIDPKETRQELSRTASEALIVAFSEADNLGDLARDQFDGLQFEYLHLKRDGGKVAQVARVLIRGTHEEDARDAPYRDFLAKVRKHVPSPK